MRFTGLWSLKVSLLLAMIAAIVHSGMLPFSATSAVHAQIFKGSQLVPGTHRGGSAAKSGPTRNLFAVIGEVQYPETYELPTGSPSLINFLKLAGGLQPNASGVIRVVRNGRVAQQLYYDERSTMTLSPGDFVVVDSKVGQGRIVRGGEPGPVGSDEQIYIGLVGVLDYPFVMQTSARRATTAWIAEQLGQSEELTKSTKTLMPRSFGQVTAETLLPANTIIQFDPSKVVVSRLPDGLPRPFRPGYDQRGQAVAQAQPPMNSAAAPSANAAEAAQGAPRRSAPNAADVVVIAPLPDVIEDGSVRLDPEPIEPPAGRVRLQERGTASVRSPRPSLPEPKRLDLPDRAGAAAAAPRAAPLPDTSAEARRPFESSGDDNEEFVAAPIQRGLPQPGSSKPGETVELPMSPVMDNSGLPSFDEDRLSKPKSRLTPDAGLLATKPKPALQGVPAVRRGVSAEPIGSPSVISKEQIAAVAVGATPERPFPEELSIAGKIDSEPESDGLNAVTVLMMLIGGAGAFAVTWMLLSVVRAEPISYAVPQTAPLRSALDMLVNNELPMQVEEFRLPSSVHIHGRPLDLARLRVDTASAVVQRPHFLRRTPDPVSAVLPTENSEVSTQSDVGGDQPLNAAAEPSEISALSSRNVVGEHSEKVAAVVSTAPRTTSKYRIDSGTPSLTKAEVPVPHLVNPGATVKPSRVIAEGSDIIDRALERAQEMNRKG